MSLYLLLPLLALAANLALAGFALRGQWRAEGHRVFAFFLVSMAAWGGLLFLMRSSPTLARALDWERIVIVDVAFISVLYLQFTYRFSGIKPARGVMPAAYGALALISILTALGLTVEAMQVKPYGYAPVLGPAFYGFIVFTYLAVILGAANVYQTYRHGPSAAFRNRAAYLLAGTVLSLVGGVTDILPVLGIPIYPLGIVGNMAFAALATVAMVKGRLVDIGQVLRRTVSYGVIIGIVLGGYALMANGTSRWSGTNGPPSFWMMGAFIGLALYGVPRLGRPIQRWLDHGFYRTQYSALEALERFSQEVRDVDDAGSFAGSLVSLVQEATGTDFVTLVQPDDKRRFFRSTSSAGADQGIRLPFGAETALDRLAGFDRVLGWQEASLFPEWGAIPISQRTTMEEAGVRLFVPMKVKDELVGVLILGQKSAGRSYTQQDLDFLQAVANQAAAGLENARLYQALHAELRSNERRVEAFRAAAVELTLEEQPGPAMARLVEVARVLVGADAGAVMTRQAGSEAQTVFATSVAEGLPPRMEDGAEGRMAALLEASSSTAAARGSATSVLLRSRGQRGPESAYVAVPFACKDHSGGLLFMERETGGEAFTDADERLLNLFGVLASVMLDNMRLFREEARERATLGAIQASMMEGLLVLDAEKQIVYVNRAAGQLLGISEDESRGHDLRRALARRLRDFDDHGSAVFDTLDALEPGADPVDLTVLRPLRHDLEVTVFPIASAAVTPMTGMLIRDVTEQRDLDRRRDTFVSVASHELRTPMTGIVGFAELLMEAGPADDKHKRWLQYVLDQANRLTVILDDMLDVSRIQAGGTNLTIERLRVADVADEVLAGLRTTYDTHLFDLDIPADLPKVLADRDKLSQVLINLVSNAAKYSPEGGRVLVRARPGVTSPDDIVIEVRDEGLGIAPEDIGRLFETFFRVSRPETHEIRGTGLGLYIVKSLAELMRGSVWVESDLGAGSTFYVSLPAAPTAEVRRGGSHERESALR